MAMEVGDKAVCALLAGLRAPVPYQKRQGGLRIAVQQFMNQLHPEKAGRAGYQDEFFTIH
jgi:hypothetical protein